MSRAFVLSVVLGGVLGGSVAHAQGVLEYDVDAEPHTPRAFYILPQRALPELRVGRLPPHARGSWMRFREVEGRLQRRHRERAGVLVALDDAVRARGASREQARRERASVLDDFGDITTLQREMERALDRALQQFRRAHPEHGLAQLALTELERTRAAIDLVEAHEEFQAATEGGRPVTDPPELPSLGLAVGAAERAARALHGTWRAWALYLLGCLASHWERPVRASAAFTAALEEPATRAHTEIALRLGDAHFAERRWDDATASYERALQLGGDPTFEAIASYKLQWAHLNAGRWSEARARALALLDRDDGYGREAREVVLPLALAGASDHAGTGLPTTIPAERRGEVMLALSRMLAFQLGDRAAAHVALEAASTFAPRPGAQPTELSFGIARQRQLLGAPGLPTRLVESLARAAVWTCMGSARERGTFVAFGRLDATTAGFTEVIGAGAAEACMRSRFASPPAAGHEFRVHVRF